MPLESMKLTIKKQFEDDLTAGSDRQDEVVFTLKRRSGHQGQASDKAFVEYPVPQANGTSSTIVLNKANDWTYSVYVSPGLEDHDGKILEAGYDFRITEADLDYHYDLIDEIINPMVVNGQDVFYGDGELLNGETVDFYADNSLTAVNRVKSGIDVKKVVVDPDGKVVTGDDTEFSIVGYILDKDGHPFTFNPAWDDRTDKSTANGASETWVAHQNDTGAYHKYDASGKQIIYKGHFASTDAISFTLKNGEYIRFINVPEGCTFEFYESSVPADYEENC